MESWQEHQSGPGFGHFCSEQTSFSLRYPVPWDQQPLMAGLLGALKPRAFPALLVHLLSRQQRGLPCCLLPSNLLLLCSSHFITFSTMCSWLNLHPSTTLTPPRPHLEKGPYLKVNSQTASESEPIQKTPGAATAVGGTDTNRWGNAKG